MIKKATEYSRWVRMFCTPPFYPFSDSEMNPMKKAGISFRTGIPAVARNT
jgi:hypothetical protein